ncbi:DUF4238 domain-containing protein [Sphaerisporangium sp. NBC_01403]|uniref:DUF4238 domain-containing protein n=1 Tax=Sphaerisporangium sp. NBC_01403 TaxID=2903599 RepID=UPI00324EB426
MSEHVKKQHLVSKVLLKRFTALDAKSGEMKLVSFDLNHPSARTQVKTPTEVGYSIHFVSVDSRSLEELWGETERMVPAVFSAIDLGEPYKLPENADALRNLIALHLVRSHRYKTIHETSYHRAFDELRARMLEQHYESLQNEALRVTGLYLHGSALEAFLDRMLRDSAPAKGFTSGQLLRTNIEEMYQKIRNFISEWEPELLTAKDGQFIMGDSPATTLRWPSGQPDLNQPVQFNVAITDAHAVVLPIDPKHLVALGPRRATMEVERPVVERLNAYQVLVAHRHVFFRPNSETELFIRNVCPRRTPIAPS